MDTTNIEQEIIARVRALDSARQQQVLEFVRGLDQPALPLGEWLKKARALREELRAKYGDVFDVVADLDEVREERLNDLMGGS